MGKYKNEVKEYIIDNVDIEREISGYMNLKRVGSSVKGLCPFHGEKTPSFCVSSSWQNYHCFGCSEHGNVIDFIMQMENLDFISAIEHLAQTNGLDITKFLNEKEYKVDKRIKKSYEINIFAAKYFREKLKSNQSVKEYLSDRKISPETVIKFGIGYAPDAWDELYMVLKKAGYTDDELLYSKIVKVSDKNGKIYDTFRNRLIIPILDNRKRVVGFGARSLGDEKPKYLNSSESEFFKKSKILYGQGFDFNKSRLDECILVEGYMDVIKLSQVGFTNIFASMGTSLTEEQAYELSKKYKKLIFAYDMDLAGRNAIDRSLPILEKYDIDIRVLELTNAKDPDEYISKFGRDMFVKRLEDTIDVYHYNVTRLRQGLDFKNASDKRTYIDLAVDLLLKLDSKVDVQLYAQEISNDSGIRYETIMEFYQEKSVQQEIEQQESELNRSLNRTDYNKVNQEKTDIKQNATNMSKIDRLELKLLQIAVSSKDMFNNIFDSVGGEFLNPKFSLALLTLKEYYSKVDNFDVNSAVEYMELKKVVFLEQYLDENIDEIDEIILSKLLIKREKEICLNDINILTRELKELSAYKDKESKVQSRLKLSELMELRKKHNTFEEAEKLI